MATIAIEIDKDELRDFCRRWKITEFALFGSVTYAFGPASDVLHVVDMRELDGA